MLEESIRMILIFSLFETRKRSRQTNNLFLKQNILAKKDLFSQVRVFGEQTFFAFRFISFFMACLANKLFDFSKENDIAIRY